MLRQAHANPKLARLARKLGIRRYQAVGILECLWHFTSTQAPRGDVGRWTNEEIAAALDWDGDDDALIESLVDCRWLDASPRYRLLVHDWPTHCDQTVQRCQTVKREGFAVDKLASDERETSETLVYASEPLVDCEQMAQATSAPLVSLSPDPEPDPDPDPEPDQREPSFSLSPPGSKSEPERPPPEPEFPPTPEGVMRLFDQDDWLRQVRDDLQPEPGTYGSADPWFFAAATYERAASRGVKSLKRWIRANFGRASPAEIVRYRRMDAEGAFAHMKPPQEPRHGHTRT